MGCFFYAFECVSKISTFECVNCTNLKYTNHAIEFIGKRAITESEVVKVIEEGEVIESYETDKPFPSKLIFAMINERPIHIVLAYDDESQTCFIVTAYEPNLFKFDIDFKTRRKKS